MRYMFCQWIRKWSLKITYFIFILKPTPRCTRCAEFTARCRKATEINVRSQLERAQQQHLKDMLQYRAIQTRLCALSEAATKGDGVAVSASILKLDLDGLDQAKTRWPRLVENSKSLSACWRPQAHVVGAIAWGVSWINLFQSVSKNAASGFGICLIYVDSKTIFVKHRSWQFTLSLFTVCPQGSRGLLCVTSRLAKWFKYRADLLDTCARPGCCKTGIKGNSLTWALDHWGWGANGPLKYIWSILQSPFNPPKRHNASKIPILSALPLQTDNCAREGKNAIVAKWSASGVINHRCLSSQTVNFQKLYFPIWW